MRVSLKEIDQTEETTIQHLYQLYQYEFSKYVSSLAVDSQGKFKLADMRKYWSDGKYHAFLILANDKIAGFAMIREEEKNMPNFVEQFFVLQYFSGQGIGKAAAKQIFSKFSGNWQVLQIKNNYPAQAFWRSVITDFTNNHFEERYDPDDDRSSIQEFRS
ncbi:GNAT family N-acetyltransferase [Lactiplantibacillus plantarum]|uniref:GNAT family N-acetyltransferase n=1 Tax=Lactiplantibacillus plantarum TaxID=1590 RepID=UPI000977AE3D|nr:GNAT family N-acetyltransferase [Lactiplantibacillus plantarum]